MIRIRRQGAPPAWISPRDAEAALDVARRHFALENSTARQREFAFPPLQDQSHVLDALSDLFNGKCAFCESPLNSDQGYAHRFRPPQEAVDAQGKVSRIHYWWLAYQWDNLYYTCLDCSRGAGANFPVGGTRGRVGDSIAALRRSEKPFLVDPCWDRPEEHLIFDDGGFAEPATDRGEQTIKVFRLNRESLLLARRDAIGRALDAVNRAMRGSDLVSELVLVLVDRIEYQAAVRCAIARRLYHGGVDPQLLGLLDLDRYLQNVRVYRTPPTEVQPVRLRRLTLHNIRAAEHLDIAFPESSAPWTMLLGDNGHGKTTILRAAALALMGSAARARLDLDTDSWIRTGADWGEIVVWTEGTRLPRRLRLRRGLRGFEIQGDDFPAALAAYGAGRLPPLRGRVGLPRRYRVRPRIENLFDPHAEMMPVTPWLLQLEDDETFDFAGRAILGLLLEPASSVLVREHDDVVLRRSAGSISLDLLSDGYRSMLTLAVDLMSTFLKRFGSLSAAEGIVLVDEISAHLHPRWQMRVVKAFQAAFPRLQIVATTHDPLSLRGVGDSEVVVLRRDRERRVSRLPADETPSVRGLRVDELLTSEIFGLNSTVDEELDALYARYYDLLASRDKSQSGLAELETAREQLNQLRQFGTTRRERLALEAADRYLAEERDTPDPDDRELLDEELRNELRAIWSGET